MAPDRECIVRAEWDPDASVWVVVESDVPGLCTEASTQEELVAKLRVMIPELLELNDGDSFGPELAGRRVVMSLRTDRTELLNCA